MMVEPYDILGVSLTKPNRVRVMATEKDYQNAEAYVNMAVLRRGVTEEFFVAVPTGTYQDGEAWVGKKEIPSTQYP